MSLGDFLVHRLLSTQQQHGGDGGIPPSPVPSCSSSDDGSSATASLLGQQALALQLAQFQMLCQAAFLAQIQQQQQHNQQIKTIDDVLLPSAALSPSASSSTSCESSESRKRAFKPNTAAADHEGTVAKKAKTAKRVHLDDAETNSPVSGMFIKDASDIPSTEELQKEADLDESAPYVNVSDESRQAISQIPNVIGDSVCALCKVRYEDVFKLAQHKCPRIVHEAYKCPECDKVFSCPANLASHRRWHKPRSETQQSCPTCEQKFDSKKQLKAHSCLLTASPTIASLLFS